MTKQTYTVADVVSLAETTRKHTAVLQKIAAEIDDYLVTKFDLEKEIGHLVNSVVPPAPKKGRVRK